MKSVLNITSRIFEKIGRYHILGCKVFGGAAALSFIVTIPLLIVMVPLTWLNVVPYAWLEVSLFLVYLGVCLVTSAVGFLFISVAWAMVMFAEHQQIGCVLLAILVMVGSVKLLMKIIRR